MPRASKGKQGVKKVSFSKGVQSVVNSAKSAREDVKKFRDEWAKKFNTLVGTVNALEDRLKKVATAIGQQLAVLGANQSTHMDAIEHLDIYNQANARALLECFGRFAQIDHYLKQQGFKAEDISQSELTTLKKDALQSYEDTMRNCFELVHQERKAKLEEMRRKQEEQRKVAQEAMEEADEKELVAKELRQAEDRSIMSQPGGQGAEIPEGAEVFGG